MSKTDKPLLNKKESAINRDLLEKIENLLISLINTDESEAFDLEGINHLTEELDKNPGLAEGLFQKILSQPTARLMQLLALLLNQVASKPVQKGIKRALYILKQKGLVLPDDLEKKEEPGGRGILKAMDSVQAIGYLSEFDPARNRMLAMLIPKGPQGKLFMFALVEPEGNLGNLTALEVSKKGAKEILGDLAEHSGHSFLEADPGQVAFLLKEAHDRKSGLTPEDEGIYAAILSLLSSMNTINPIPLVRSLFPMDQELCERPLVLSRLLAIPEVSYYQPADELIQPYQKAIQEVQDGILILSQTQKREQVNEIILRACREIFHDQGKTDLLRYLEELAYLYYLKGQTEEAKTLFSAAHSLEDQKEPLKSEENPLLLWLMERSLGGEAIEDSQDPADQFSEQTPGGIIIPPWVKK